MSFETAIRHANWLNAERAVAYPKIFLLVYVLVGLLSGTGLINVVPPDGSAYGFDFMNVYAAGEAIHKGSPSDAYDWKGQSERERQIEKSLSKKNEARLSDETKPYGYIPWLYPPTFLSVAWLVALVPFLAALAVYSAAGLFAYGVVLYKLIGSRYTKAVWAIAAFPGFYVNLLAGQNGAITTALLGAGLLLLDKAPVAAGIFFGILSYKPHLFVLVPLALLAGRHWKALVAALASAGVCAFLSLAAFGFDSWTAFLRGLPTARTVFLESDEAFRWLGIMHTPFSAIRMMGGDVQTAYAFQAIVAVLAVLVLVYIWSRKAVSPAVRASALIAVMLLASPYSFGYDQVMLAIPIAWLAIEGIEKKFLPFEKIFLLALWLLPVFAKDYGAHFALPLTPPMLAGFLILCWRRAQ